ncbi:hypothetical protein CDL15_Pgr016019 [Punica granatum]|uniref:Uncharacterized protein n=1 Tax=Punica granatum TaxID=22663 RepID=A0A218XRV1_PUNGR|nr:hypothetical protein CDL15_Pgr016019 [Punica granatum]
MHLKQNKSLLKCSSPPSPITSHSWTDISGKPSVLTSIVANQALEKGQDHIRWSQVSSISKRKEHRASSVCAPEFRLVGARMRAPKCNAAWECPPSRGRATDAREKESPLPVYDRRSRAVGLSGSRGTGQRSGWDWAELGCYWAGEAGLGWTLVDGSDADGLGRRCWTGHRCWIRPPLGGWATLTHSREVWLALPPGWLCFTGGPLCPSGGYASDLPEADLAVGSIVCYSCWQLVSPLKRLLAVNALVSPLRLLLARRLLVTLPDRRLAMRDSSSGSAYVPSWTGEQSLP